MSTSGATDLYATARRVLLDALEALEAHLDALVLVGAQAVYFHTGEADVAIATHTKDSDLVVNPDDLAAEPLLEAAMSAAGFHLNLESRQPGEWVGEAGVPVDLLVPAAVGGAGRRGARIPPHDSRAARKVHGLEAALIDNELQRVASLDPEDRRVFRLRVAGPTALLVAKLHKLGERRHKPDRLVDKDAHDIYRLLRATPVETFALVIPKLLDDKIAGSVTGAALAYLRELFSTPASFGSVVAGRAEEGIGLPAEVAASASALALDLLDAVRPSDS
jgi:hypothetical protein